MERKELPFARAPARPFPREPGLARGLLYPRPMELEHAIATELERLTAAAGVAAREIAANRPWWVAAILFLRKVAL
jgi:hypothetical protein